MSDVSRVVLFKNNVEILALLIVNMTVDAKQILTKFENVYIRIASSLYLCFCH